MLEAMLKRANLMDVLIVIIGSLAIIGVWRGAWNLMDKFLLPTHFVWSQIISMTIGILVLIILSRYN